VGRHEKADLVVLLLGMMGERPPVRARRATAWIMTLAKPRSVSNAATDAETFIGSDLPQASATACSLFRSVPPGHEPAEELCEAHPTHQRAAQITTADGEAFQPAV
jgi:hypothetical protein